MQLLTQWFLHSSSVPQPCWVLLPGLIHCTRPIILHVLMLKLSAQHSVPGHLPSLCWKMCLTVKCQVHLPTCAAFRWRLLMFGRAHHVSIDFICQNGDAMSGGHWEDTGDSSVSQICALRSKLRNQETGGWRTFEDLLNVLFGEDGATGVGGIGDNQAGGPLVDQALQVFEVSLPRLLWLQINDVHCWFLRLQIIHQNGFLIYNSTEWTLQ